VLPCAGIGQHLVDLPPLQRRNVSLVLNTDNEPSLSTCLIRMCCAQYRPRRSYCPAHKITSGVGGFNRSPPVRSFSLSEKQAPMLRHAAGRCCGCAVDALISGVEAQQKCQY
jgi:hypothetical protein